MKRTLSFVLILAMLFTAMLGLIPSAEGDSAPALTISGANLEFGDTIYLYVAVDYSVLGSSNNVRLKVKNTATGEEKIFDPDESVKNTEGFPPNSVGFKLDNLAAKNMGDELTLTPMNGNTAITEAEKTYSILEYALRSESANQVKLTALVKAMINYGAKAQKAFKEENTKYTYDLSVDHSLMRLPEGATFANGAKKAIMKAGDDPLTATKLNAGDTWFNVAAQKLGKDNTITVNYTEDNQTYFAAAESTVFGGSSNYYFNMDDYTGETKVCTTSAAAKGTYTGIYCSGIVNSGYSITYANGYVKMQGNVSLNAMGTTQWQNTVKEVAASNNKVFTLSLTVATDAAATSGAFAAWYLRRGCPDINDPMYKLSGGTYSPILTYDAKNDVYTDRSTDVVVKNYPYYKKSGEEFKAITYAEYGRVMLLKGNANAISTYYNDQGKVNSVYNEIATPTATSTTEPGKFVTVHIVFDLEKLTMTYYSGDSATPTATVALPVDVNYLSGSYLEHYGGASYNCYLKSAIVTKCDLSKYLG